MTYLNFRYELEPRGDYAFIDMKSFYASCELLARNKDPLHDLLIVMSTTDNSSGLILSSSPMAKKRLGIKNVDRKWNLPDPAQNPYMKELMIVAPRMRYYIAKNLEIQNVIRNYAADEDILWYSIDEGIVDLSHSLNYFVPGNAARTEKLNRLSQKIQQAIYRQTGIFSTVGMSNSNPLLAKLALDNEAKHNKCMRALWNYENVSQKVWHIPEMTDFWGIGQRTKKRLNLLGITSIEELAHASPELLHQKLGIVGLQLYHHANGIDRTKIQERYIPKNKNVGNSQILPRDYQKEEIQVVIREMAEQVAIRLRRRKAQATTVHLYLAFSKYEQQPAFSHQMKISPTDSTQQLTDHLLYLFHKYYQGGLIRQIGVTYANLTYQNGMQLNLFEDIDQQIKKAQLDQITDQIREKYGFTSIVHASSKLDYARSIKRAGLVGGHAGGAGGLDGL